jgi:hypothetical protein
VHMVRHHHGDMQPRFAAIVMKTVFQVMSRAAGGSSHLRYVSKVMKCSRPESSM